MNSAEFFETILPLTDHSLQQNQNTTFHPVDAAISSSDSFCHFASLELHTPALCDTLDPCTTEPASHDSENLPVSSQPLWDAPQMLDQEDDLTTAREALGGDATQFDVLAFERQEMEEADESIQFRAAHCKTPVFADDYALQEESPDKRGEEESEQTTSSHRQKSDSMNSAEDSSVQVGEGFAEAPAFVPDTPAAGICENDGEFPQGREEQNDEQEKEMEAMYEEEIRDRIRQIVLRVGLAALTPSVFAKALKATFKVDLLQTPKRGFVNRTLEATLEELATSNPELLLCPTKKASGEGVDADRPPKRAKSALQFYIDQMWDQMAESRKLFDTRKAFRVAITKQYEELSQEERNSYEERAAEDRNRYATEMEEWKIKHPECHKPKTRNARRAGQSLVDSSSDENNNSDYMNGSDVESVALDGPEIDGNEEGELQFGDDGVVVGDQKQAFAPVLPTRERKQKKAQKDSSKDKEASKRTKKARSESGPNNNGKKRPLNAYNLFVKDFRQQLKASGHPPVALPQLLKMAAEKWRTLSLEDQHIWKEKAVSLQPVPDVVLTEQTQVDESTQRPEEVATHDEEDGEDDPYGDWLKDSQETAEMEEDRETSQQPENSKKRKKHEDHEHNKQKHRHHHHHSRRHHRSVEEKENEAEDGGISKTSKEKGHHHHHRKHKHHHRHHRREEKQRGRGAEGLSTQASSFGEDAPPTDLFFTSQLVSQRVLTLDEDERLLFNGTEEANESHGALHDKTNTSDPPMKKRKTINEVADP